MLNLNYHHLYYFWCVARAGSISKACEELELAQPTVSSQLSVLEKSLGGQLFDRHGRTLVLTDLGKTVYEYAGQIFTVGRELLTTVKGRMRGPTARLTVGIADVVPKLIVRRFLEPFFELAPEARLICLEDKPDKLLAELSMHNLDMVLIEASPNSPSRVKAHHHLLGECGTTFFSNEANSVALKKGFPKSLDEKAFLMPTDNTVMRRSLENWFEDNAINPHVRAEFADSAMMKTFGQAGAGVFATPSVIEKEVAEEYGVVPIGRTDSIVQRFYAITVERKIKHPVVAAIIEHARKNMFG
jgi:LysR family transcriptional regulator, transcriptional activator of nhaA